MIGELRIDLGAYEVFDGRRLSLTPEEFKLLVLLVRNRGEVVRHRVIVDNVWDRDDTVRPATLRVLVNQLRRKLDEDMAPRRLLTEPSVGYRLVS